MLNYHNTNIFFTLLLVALIAIHIAYGLPYYIYVILLFIYSLIVFWGCYYIDSGFFIRITCKAATDKKQIAITFDDGPAAAHTPEILDVLRKADVKAAFFCIGNRIAGNEIILQRVKEEGHIIGNHSFSHHFWFDMYSADKMIADLQRMDEAMERATGLRPRLFRPPYGVTNPNVKKAILRGGYTPIGWSVRSMDTVTKDSRKLLAKINGAIEPGAVFLFHDTCSSTLEALPAFIAEVKNRGYEIVPLDKLLHLRPYA